MSGEGYQGGSQQHGSDWGPAELRDVFVMLVRPVRAKLVGWMQSMQEVSLKWQGFLIHIDLLWSRKLLWRSGLFPQISAALQSNLFLEQKIKNKKNHSDFILKKIKDFNAYNFEGIFSNLLLMLNIWPTTCYLPGQEHEGGTNSSMSSWQCEQWAQVWELLIKAWEGPRDQPGHGESIKHNLNTRFLIV